MFRLYSILDSLLGDRMFFVLLSDSTFLSLLFFCHIFFLSSSGCGLSYHMKCPATLYIKISFRPLRNADCVALARATRDVFKNTGASPRSISPRGRKLSIVEWGQVQDQMDKINTGKSIIFFTQFCSKFLFPITGSLRNSWR